MTFTSFLDQKLKIFSVGGNTSSLVAHPAYSRIFGAQPAFYQNVEI